MATLRKPFDISKFQKNITKTIPNISTGFNDPDTWISTGNYTLNKKISGHFDKGIPLGKVTVFAGESGSAKSFICSGVIVKNAQEQGIFTVIIDSENALDEKWLTNMGVDTSPEKLMRISASMIDDVSKIVSDFIEFYKQDYKDLPRNERPKVLIVIDSLGMLLTPTDVNQFQSGDMKGDMGRKPKALKSFMLNVVNMIGDLNIGLVVTNHTYKSQDMFNPDDTVAGGSGPIYAASIVVVMNKLKLKEDDDGNKTSKVNGIRAAIQVTKTRFTKPFEKIQIKIPYEGGMNPYSGLVDLLENDGILVKDGNKLAYTSPTDLVTIKLFRKQLEKNEGDILDKIMSEYDLHNVGKNDIDSLTEDGE